MAYTVSKNYIAAIPELTGRSIIVEPVGYIFIVFVFDGLQTLLLYVAESNQKEIGHLIVLDKLVDLDTIASSTIVWQRREQVLITGHGDWCTVVLWIDPRDTLSRWNSTSSYIQRTNSYLGHDIRISNMSGSVTRSRTACSALSARTMTLGPTLLQLPNATAPSSQSQGTEIDAFVKSGSPSATIVYGKVDQMSTRMRDAAHETLLAPRKHLHLSSSATTELA